jgi:hypothetical protein
MNNDDLPITLEDREPDEFDSYIWRAVIILSIIGGLCMTMIVYRAILWLAGGMQ